MGTQHIMELNGRKYDTQTGMPLPHAEIPASKAPPSHSPHHSIDGFVKKNNHAPRKIAGTKLAHHEPAKSSTLMRKAVKKPTTITRLGNKINNFQETFMRPEINPINSHDQLAPSTERLDRANQVKRNKLIQRFGTDLLPSPATHYANHKASHIAMQAVSQPITEDSDSVVSALENTVSHIYPPETTFRPPGSPALSRTPSNPLTVSTGTLIKFDGVLPQRSSSLETENQFLGGIQPKIKKTPVHHRIARKIKVKPRTLSISATVMAFMVLGGFFAYSNAPNLSMRLATVRSDVNGSLPGYKPAGFALSGPIKYEPGKITVAYKSNSDDRNYQITQSASKWDTESLRENYVSGLKTSYQTVQDKGKTIYLYDDASATWIDGGVWYTLEGDSRLNTDQVLRISSSL